MGASIDGVGNAAGLPARSYWAAGTELNLRCAG
jgi:hypothetical protein